MRPRRVLVAALALGIGAALLAWVLVERAGADAAPAPAGEDPGALAPDHIRVGGGGGPVRWVRPDPAPTRDGANVEHALARAFAAVGAAEDGDGSRLARLDDPARAQVPAARRLLSQVRQAATAPQADAPKTDAPQAGAPPQAAANERPDQARRPRLPEEGRTEAPASAPGVPTASSMRVEDQPRREAALAATPDGPVLKLPGLWADTRFHPQDHPNGLRITNDTTAGYAIALLAGDFSTIRLDGGLVVPGRFYLITGSALITGDVKVGVEIRPVEAVPTYLDRPQPPPTGPG